MVPSPATSPVARAARVLPSGVTHDLRWRTPAGPYFTHGLGARKWDVDGKEYVDFFQGHGALLLGIADPETVEAVDRAVRAGTHLGGNHLAEVEWAELVCALVPSADKVRFTSSATEASLLAFRLARTSTGKDVVVKFHGHFHGWHDYALVGFAPPFDVPSSPGIPTGVQGTVDAVPVDVEALRARLKRGDVAAVVVEVTGSSNGSVPLAREVLAQIVEVAREHGALVIFDETISGFRVAPGGVQEATGLVPDLSVLGKILAGGMPGGAVAGRADLMEPLEMRPDGDWNRYRHVYHPGTFNANPPSAAAGVSVLRRVKEGTVVAEAATIAAEFRAGLRDALAELPVPTAVWGGDSSFHVRLGHTEPPRDIIEARSGDPAVMAAADRYLLEHGVDAIRLGGLIGTTHDSGVLDRAIEVYHGMVRTLLETNLLEEGAAHAPAAAG